MPKRILSLALAAALALPWSVFASNHREAPITALDHKADITDLYAFVSYDNAQPNQPGSHVTLILCVDPFLDPANGPTLFPFDDELMYEIHVDNNHDARPDVTFQFRFTTDYRLPGVYTAVAGVGEDGAFAPGTDTLVVPPQIRTFDNPGLNQIQTYSVTMLRGENDRNGMELMPSGGGAMHALPANAGPRTMDYPALFDQAVYETANGLKVFAGTVDDPFWIDLGAAFDTANFRTLGSGVPGVLTAEEDAAHENFASDMVSGYGVNALAIEVPIEMLTSTGKVEPATSPNAVIGVWGTTSRSRVRVFPWGESRGPFRQVQRMGNPLINELIIGIGSKNRFSMDEPRNDAQFAETFLDPPIVKIVEALYGGALTVPAAPRTDLLPLVTYAAPIAPPGTPAGPVADLLRLNTGVPPTPVENASRLGAIAGDFGGYPNGRRLFDDVVDIVLRVGVGGVLVEGMNMFPNNALGDGVNVNDAEYRTTFPYLADSPDGRNRRHIDPGRRAEARSNNRSAGGGVAYRRLRPAHLCRSSGPHDKENKIMRIVLLLFALASTALALTPAERRIEQAEAAVERAPENTRFHTELALAYARRARETADVAYYEKAHAALDRALEISPEDFGALKIRAWTWLGQHEFRKALELAKELNKRAPDDVFVYGFLVDANVELGNYDDAIDAAQWMLDLQTGNVPALTRAAYLRELYGYLDGAIDFMRTAYERTPRHETEDLAWIQTHIAHLELTQGRLDRAEQAVTRALELFPGYHYALAELGKLRLAQGRAAEAVDAFQQRYSGAPHPENLLDIAKAEKAAGNEEEAARLFAKFEVAARAEMDNNDNCNRDLIFYYANIADQPEEALRLAERSMRGATTSTPGTPTPGRSSGRGVPSKQRRRCRLLARPACAARSCSTTPRSSHGPTAGARKPRRCCGIPSS
ncbi:MAG: DUF4331 family protein [Bryobacterales bacterium]